MRPQRQINLADPYICLEDHSRCGAVDYVEDYAVHVGETGVEFYLDFSEDLQYAAATALASVAHGAEEPVEVPAYVRGKRVSFVDEDGLFPVAGRYRIVLDITFPGGAVRKVARTIYAH